MKVMVLVKGNADSEAGKMPPAELLTAMGAYNQALLEAGVLLAGEGLHPSAAGKRVRFSGGEALVEDGPFGLDNLVSGFWLWQVASMDEALEWARKAPFDGTEIELRPVFEMEDFGDEMSPELRAQETRQREALEE